MPTVKYKDPVSGQWVPLLGDGTAAADARYVQVAGDTMTGPLTVPEPTAPGHVATKQYADSVVPAGVVMPFGGGTAPAGWFFCHGQAVSRTTYPALFAVCGTTYGVGDGSTTFNVPDVRGRSVAGIDAGQTEFAVLGGKGGARTVTLTAAHMPNWSGHVGMHNSAGPTILNTVSGVHSPSGGSSSTYHSHSNPSGGATSLNSFGFSLGFSGGAHNNMMAYRVTHYIIKAV